MARKVKLSKKQRAVIKAALSLYESRCQKEAEVANYYKSEPDRLYWRGQQDIIYNMPENLHK